MLGSRLARINQYDAINKVWALIPSVQTEFPAMGFEQAKTIAFAVHSTRLQSTLSGAQIIALLARPGNDIWDFKYRFNQFQDVAETIPITADGQSIRRITPWKGTNILNLDAAWSPLTSNINLGAEFPDSESVARFTTRRTDLLFFAIAVRPKSPNPGDTLNPFLLGDSVDYGFHPRFSYEGDSLFHNSFSSQNLRDGNFWINNSQVTFNQAMSTISFLLSIQPSGAINAHSIAADRIYHDPANGPYKRTFYGRAFLYLLSSETFTTDEINALNNFVMAYTGVGL